jgi:hypothetical protein
MIGASTTGVFALAVTLTATIGNAQAADGPKYPNWKGQWDAVNPTFGGRASSSIRPSGLGRRNKRR